jgi:hypothetical protein
MGIEYLDRPPAGCFVVDVMRQTKRKWDWAALMSDINPDSEAFREWKHRLSSRWQPFGVRSCAGQV